MPAGSAVHTEGHIWCYVRVRPSYQNVSQGVESVFAIAGMNVAVVASDFRRPATDKLVAWPRAWRFICPPRLDCPPQPRPPGAVEMTRFGSANDGGDCNKPCCGDNAFILSVNPFCRSQTNKLLACLLQRRLNYEDELFRWLFLVSFLPHSTMQRNNETV